jgi:hypothetical protein
MGQRWETEKTFVHVPNFRVLSEHLDIPEYFRKAFEARKSKKCTLDRWVWRRGKFGVPETFTVQVDAVLMVGIPPWPMADQQSR